MSNDVVSCGRTVVDFGWVVDDCVFVSTGELVENVTVDVSCDMDWFGTVVTADGIIPVECVTVLPTDGPTGVDVGCEEIIWGEVRVSLDVS